MDPLAQLSDVEDDSEASSSEGEEEEDEKQQQAGSGGGKAAGEDPATKRQKQQAIDLETLKAHGYKGGPSVLFVPDKHDDGEQNWAWWVGGKVGKWESGAGRHHALHHSALLPSLHMQAIMCGCELHGCSGTGNAA